MRGRRGGGTRGSALAIIAMTAACFDPAESFQPPTPEPTCPMSSSLRRNRAMPEGASEDGGDDGGADGEDRLTKLVRFAVIGDFGLDGMSEAKVADLVASWDPDFIVTTGDNNYFEGSEATIDRNIGKYYCQFIGNYLGKPGQGSAVNRFWPSPGNHDWLAPGLRPYTDYFTLPGNERYYDVARGLVHLHSVDSDFGEPDGNTKDSVQAHWLKGTLANSTACFDVVFFHHPPFSSGPHGSTFEMQWPFEAWGADVVLAGHDHDYERLEVGGIPYFTVGLGGASIYDFVTILPETRMQYHDQFGALRVTADRHGMTFEFIDVNGTLVDVSTYRKECP
jgi:tartrate-resistant acid phosphatase type 5